MIRHVLPERRRRPGGHRASAEQLLGNASSRVLHRFLAADFSQPESSKFVSIHVQVCVELGKRCATFGIARYFVTENYRRNRRYYYSSRRDWRSRAASWSSPLITLVIHHFVVRTKKRDVCAFDRNGVCRFIEFRPCYPSNVTRSHYSFDGNYRIHETKLM
ncbi:hypothetical protein PUN28_009364 [Cardiocondyla obscurior]|uniref:Uncharacterized protein n=1 Tax=Cardiocondyla obscurior TaxID=286306 RepID=A0AAW2FTE3_9HYME